MTMPRLLTQDCGACNRPFGTPMCDLCAALEAAEDNPTDPTERTPDYADD